MTNVCIFLQEVAMEEQNSQNKRPDRRIVKTRKAIRNALAELLTRKEIGSVTVKDIAELADINRKTFYNYYNGVDQVVDEIENEVASSFDKALAGVDRSIFLEEPKVIYDRLNDIINGDIEFYGQLLKMNGNVSLATKIAELLKEKVKSTLSEQFELEYPALDIALDYSISGMVRVYQNWVNSDCNIPLEQLSEYVGIMSVSGLKGLIT